MPGPASSSPRGSTPAPQRSTASGRSAFRAFVLARTLSFAATAMTPVALTFAVLSAPDARPLLGMILAAQMVPMLALMILGGGVADRVPRILILRIATAVMGIADLASALTLLSGASPLAVVPLMALSGTASAFLLPALRGIVPELVPGSEVQRANALLATIRTVTRLAGPGAAGVIAAVLAGPAALIVAAVLLLCAALALLRVHTPPVTAVPRKSAPAAPRESLLAGAVFGVPVLMLALWPNLVALMSASALAGAAAAVAGISWESALQTRIPRGQLSRVAAIDDLIAWGSIPVGQLAALPIAHALGAQPALVVGGIAVLLATLATLLLMRVRVPEPL